MKISAKLDSQLVGFFSMLLYFDGRFEMRSGRCGVVVEINYLFLVFGC